MQDFDILMFYFLHFFILLRLFYTFLYSQGSIRTTLMIYKSASDEEELTRVPSEAIDTLLGPLMVLSLALLTSTFVMFLVEERVSKFAHQVCFLTLIIS